MQMMKQQVPGRHRTRQTNDGAETPSDIVIALSTDGNYARHTGTTIASLLLNSNGNRFIEIVVLDGGLSETDRARMASLEAIHSQCSISFLDFKHFFHEIPPRNDSYSPANYFRLLLPTTLRQHDRVLYLDSDIIVLSDLGSLFDTDLESYCIGACEDMGMKAILDYNLPPHSIMGAVPFRKYFGDYLGIRFENQDRYFNSGVLLMDLGKLRQHQYEERFVKFLKQYEGRFFLADQDILNHFFQGNYRFLDLSWNMQLYDLDWSEQSLPDDIKKKLRSAFDLPRVIHFTGPENKPWMAQDTHYADIYWSYFRETPWSENV
jgi:lipopolysaccharide biosynthesis glycosyltransferase